MELRYYRLCMPQERINVEHGSKGAYLNADASCFKIKCVVITGTRINLLLILVIVSIGAVVIIINNHLKVRDCRATLHIVSVGIGVCDLFCIDAPGRSNRGGSFVRLHCVVSIAAIFSCSFS